MALPSKRLHFCGMQESIIDAIRHYGFAAIVEVTNGSHYRKKRRQKSEVMKMFKRKLHFPSMSVKFEYGIAVIKSGSQRLQTLKPDFHISVPYLDPILFRECAIHSLNSHYLSSSEKRSLESLLEISEMQGSSLQQLISTEKKEDAGSIKGVIAEKYVEIMFKDVMKEAWWRYFSRLDYEDKDNCMRDIDLLLICKQADFRDALYRLGDKFRKVIVLYHNQKL